MKPVNDSSHTGVDAKLKTLRRDVPPRNDLWPRFAAQLEANQVVSPFGIKEPDFFGT